MSCQLCFLILCLISFLYDFEKCHVWFIMYVRLDVCKSAKMFISSQDTLCTSESSLRELGPVPASGLLAGLPRWLVCVFSLSQVCLTACEYFLWMWERRNVFGGTGPRVPGLVLGDVEGEQGRGWTGRKMKSRPVICLPVIPSFCSGFIFLNWVEQLEAGGLCVWCLASNLDQTQIHTWMKNTLFSNTHLYWLLILWVNMTKHTRTHTHTQTHTYTHTHTHHLSKQVLIYGSYDHVL